MYQPATLSRVLRVYSSPQSERFPLQTVCILFAKLHTRCDKMLTATISP